MQHAPNVDVVGPFDMENPIGTPRQRPAAQARQVQFVRVAGQAGRRVAADVAIGLLQGVDESRRCRPGILSQVVRDGLVDVPGGLLTRDDRLPSPTGAGLGGLMQLVTQTIKVNCVGCGDWRGRGARQQKPAKLEPILIPADQLAHILAAGAVTALADLLVHEGLEAVGQGNVHRAHVRRLRHFEKI